MPRLRSSSISSFFSGACVLMVESLSRTLMVLPGERLATREFAGAEYENGLGGRVGRCGHDVS
jgi:hypothetical protein